MAELWSDYSDVLITNMDKQLGTKYRFSLRSLLTDPTKYAAQQNVGITIGNMKEDVGKYIDQRVGELADEQKELDDAASKADSMTRQLSQSISMYARQGNVPVITPVAIDRDTTKEERVYVDTVDNGVMSLVQRLVAASMLIADFGTKYKSYSIGNWLFSGSKNYMLSVYMPGSPVLSLETSRDELDGLLDAASNFVKGL